MHKHTQTHTYVHTHTHMPFQTQELPLMLTLEMRLDGGHTDFSRKGGKVTMSQSTNILQYLLCARYCAELWSTGTK